MDNDSLDQNDIIAKFKKFEKRSYDRWKSLFDRIEDDRKYIAGDQLDDIDKQLIGVDNASECKMNVVQNAIRTITNTYFPNQFKWNYTSEQFDPQLLNAAAYKFISDIDNATASCEGLSNAVGTGLGVLVFSTDYDIDGTIRPLLYSVPDVTNVRLDPDATKLNFADASEAAIIELKKRSQLADQYNIEIFDENPIVDISEVYDKSIYIPLVTYYRKDDGKVTVYKLLNDVVLEAIELPYSYIPVVPVFGEQVWDEDKMTYRGITYQMRSIQRLINYSYRQLILRCAKSPKNTWAADAESIEGFQKYYQNSDKSLNPLLMYNGWSTDRKRQLSPPTRLTNNIEFDDVSQLMQNALGLTNTVIGIPATGLETNVEKTATEALLNEKTFNNNVRSYMYHLRYSMQLIGLLFAEELMKRQLYGIVKVEVIEGPDEAMARQEARVTLQQMAALVNSDEDRQKLLIAQCNIDKENSYIDYFGKLLMPKQTQTEMMQQEQLNQAGEMLQQKDAQIAELTQRIKDLETEQKLTAYSLDREMTLNDQKFQHDKELKILDAQLKAQDPAEMAKTEAEVVKAEATVQKEALSLEKEYAKAAQPQVTVVEGAK